MMRYDFGQGPLENWIVGEDCFDPEHQGKCEAILCQGNGYLGQRAALEEPYVGQTRDLLVTGTFDRFDEDEVTELPNLPDLTNLQLYLNGERFAMAEGNTAQYRRQLNLQSGELERSLIWRDAAGRRCSIRFQRFVSLAREHILGFRCTVTPMDAEVCLRVDSGIDGRTTNTGTSHFHEGGKRIFDNRVLRMISVTVQSGVTCCLSAVHRCLLDGADTAWDVLPVIDRRQMLMRGSLTVPAGQTFTLEKICCVTTSRDQACEGAADPAARAAEACMTLLEEAQVLGYDALLRESAACWQSFWDRADIRVDSARPFDQLLVRFALYHLHIMVKRDDPRVGIGAKGLTGEGYKGHSFWDTEIFLLPCYIFTEPETARTLLRYRYLGLQGARHKAAENGYRGAMYPWEAAWVDDGEVTPLWGAADIVTGKQIPILTGMIEQHITADIAFAVQLYRTVTGDEAFMRECGYEILMDTARFWVSRLEWDGERGAWVIRDVIGPDEYKEHVDNNAYTNYMAARNLRLGLEAIRQVEALGGETAARLRGRFDFAQLREDIGDRLSKLYLPRPDEAGIIPQFDGYMNLKHIDLTPYKQSDEVGTIYQDYNNEQISSFQVHKQADTLVLMLLLEELFTSETKHVNYDFYEARTLHDSSLSKSTHCVLAADLGRLEQAYGFFAGCGEIDLGPKMNTSDMGIHTASMGGIWQSAVYGFGGIRVVGDHLRLEPHLPAAWRELRFRIIWRGNPLCLRIIPEAAEVANTGTEPVTLVHRGEEIRVAAGETRRITL